MYQGIQLLLVCKSFEEVEEERYVIVLTPEILVVPVLLFLSLLLKLLLHPAERKLASCFCPTHCRPIAQSCIADIKHHVPVDLLLDLMKFVLQSALAGWQVIHIHVIIPADACIEHLC